MNKMNKQTEKLIFEFELLKLAFVELAHAVGDRIPKGSHLETQIYRWENEMFEKIERFCCSGCRTELHERMKTYGLEEVDVEHKKEFLKKNCEICRGTAYFRVLFKWRCENDEKV